ncbi:acid phosphatase [Stenotrophobium rhamnosiphilum]|uniref:Acid phosphatase n=1 Tax=Stenotrophobium rhamnosiphilum TaxID=2029166 RepID=A0A2T5MKF3_9GAMM|nr:acid phosphatase [Stenotrophobium rhamnosiphilum]PTU33039.1 acid phosphatase [Stenotrophobium rhamnosiphilum]
MKFSFRLFLLAAALAASLSACTNNDTSDRSAAVTAALQDKVQNIVVIYAENRSFDNLYGNFAGANGIPGVNPTAVGTLIPQTDRNVAETVFTSLPQVWGGATAAGQTPVVSAADTLAANLPNKPFPIESAYGAGKEMPISVITRDLYHRFYENQMQINGGKNDKFVAYADAGGLVMGYYDGSKMAMWNVAKQFTLADNFFIGAYGGSFLNHQYLICACAPEYPNADDAASPAKNSISAIDTDTSGNFLPRLTQKPTSPASAIDGVPTFVNSSTLTPKNYFGDGKFHAINTMQPPYQPSSNAPAASDAAKLYADPSKANTLPAQTATNIGDLLTTKGVSWKWYAGAWDQISTAASTTRDFGSSVPGAAPTFQFHHQPFNYYSNLDPVTHAAQRKAHLQDYNDLVADIAGGTLPQVTFYKPEGDLNQHAGYASVKAGDDHIVDLLTKLQASPQWKNMVVVVTYDENGGFWDHVAPPKGDKLGPGTRIPAIIISPYSKKNTVDHTQYDTASILRLITRRFELDTLPGLTARDTALKANGFAPMGDLTNALTLQ